MTKHALVAEWYTSCTVLSILAILAKSHGIFTSTIYRGISCSRRYGYRHVSIPTINIEVLWVSPSTTCNPYSACKSGYNGSVAPTPWDTGRHVPPLLNMAGHGGGTLSRRTANKKLIKLY